jgi:hypothetical protein
MLIWLFSILIGGLIGMNKGQEWSGIIWSVLLGPIGVIVTLCLPNLTRQRVDAESMRMREVELQVQRDILRELKQSRADAAPPSPPPAIVQRRAPAPAPDMIEEFIPESLRPIARHRR